jgi:DNA polymerase (family 10)
MAKVGEKQAPKKPRAGAKAPATRAASLASPPSNETIARALDEVADILELEGENRFRVRAYHNAARTIRGLGEEVAVRLARGGGLDDLEGIGEDLAKQIAEMIATGHLARLDRLLPAAPKLALELTRVSGLGPKRAMAIYEGLKPRPKSLQDVLAACREGRVRKLAGFGARSEQALLARLTSDLAKPTRYLRARVAATADALLAKLKGLREVESAEIAGSFRRRKETVGDLDIVVASTSPQPVMAAVLANPDIERILAGGATRASVVLKSGVQVDVRVVAPESYGAALAYFTGGKAHTIALRRMAQQAGLKINEYGVFRGEERIAGRDEASVYESLGLDLVEPEMRENAGEIAMAQRHALPRLVRREDIRGDLHAHTDASDGANSLAEMAAAARDHGLEYLAITDHSPHLTIARGLSPERLREQSDAIDALNNRRPGVAILKGVEVDILADGRLDLPDDALAKLDIVIAAVNSDFELPRDQQTKRILRALDNKYVVGLAHPTGRLLLKRDGYDIDLARILRAARSRGQWLEINGQPDRLDLSDVNCRMAKQEGVLLGVASDAYRTSDFVNLAYGVDQARRGWLEAKDVVNTRGLAELKALIRTARG